MATTNTISNLQDRIKVYWDRANLYHHIHDGIKYIEEKGRVIDRLYFTRAIGIDINTDLISMAYLSKGFNGIRVVRSYSFPNPIPPAGIIPHKEAEEKFLKEVDKFANDKDTDWDNLIIGIPRSQVILKHITIPAPDEKLIKKILEFEIERHVPLKAEEIYYDFHVAGRLDKNIFKVLIVAVRRGFIDYYLSLLKKINAEPTMANVSSLALCNFFSFNSPSLSLAVGEGKTEFVYNKEADILLNVNGRELDIDIVGNGGVSFSRGIRLDEGIRDVGGYILSDQLNIEKLGDIISTEISTAVASLKRLEGEINIKKVFLFGQLASAKGIGKYIEERVRIKDETFALPSPNNGNNQVKNGLNILTDNASSGFSSGFAESAATIGLALCGITKGELNINLLPKSQRSKKKDHSIFITLIMLLLVFVLAPASLFSWIVKDRFTLSRLERELSDVKSKASIVEKMDIKSGELEEHIKSFNKVKAGRVSRLEIMRELTDMLSPDVWLSEVYITDEGIEINGYAGTASNLIQIMENSPVFINVRFDGTITKDSGRERFKIKAGIEGFKG
ncbi:MAG: pilus assembly protein PilM [Nitrospinae bacterium]|nr:pilus assembly protein PilM [Nitrospinota bacterium]